MASPQPSTSPRHVGIVGVSPEGTSLFYREFFRTVELRHPGVPQPRVTLHNEPFAAYLDAVDRNDWQSIGQYLAESARKVAACGAEMVVVPDNLMQFGVQLAEHASPIPWIKMTDAVADAVTADKRTAVGIIGTRLVMEGSTYQTILGIKGVKVIAPQVDDAQMIDDIIFDELVHGTVKTASRAKWQQAITRLAGRGAQGVILANTEAPLLLSAADSPLPVYDSISLLADTCVDKCFA